MKKIVGLIFLVILSGAFPALGADFQVNAQFQASTGDSDFDVFLKNFNSAAGGQITGFIQNLSSAFSVPENNVQTLIQVHHFQPAEVFLLFQLVKISGRPLDDVLYQYREHGRKGWGATALSLGIKPGSREFMLLKQDIPGFIVEYERIGAKGSKGSKGSKGLKVKKGSKGSKGSKGLKVKKGSKDGKGSKGSKGKGKHNN